MKKSSIIALTFLATSAFAQVEPIGYPGSTWSALTINPSPINGTPEDGNILLQGKIEQGIDWQRYGTNKEWTLNTYASIGYSADKNGLAYNNKLVPAVGIKMRRSFDSGIVDVGAEVAHQRNFKQDVGPKSGTGVMVYVSYWFGWNLAK